MGRKGEERERWPPPGGRSPVAPREERPGDGPGWLDPMAGASRDPFTRRRPLGPKGYRRPDDRIRDEVCESIARSGIDARDVEVAVEAGEVTLSGTAGSREDKRALEDLADDVYGVEDVHNQIRLRRAEAPGAAPAGADAAPPGEATEDAGSPPAGPQRRGAGRRGRAPRRTH
jgi:hypothetical protein